MTDFDEPRVRWNRLLIYMLNAWEKLRDQHGFLGKFVPCLAIVQSAEPDLATAIILFYLLSLVRDLINKVFFNRKVSLKCFRRHSFTASGDVARIFSSRLLNKSGTLWMDDSSGYTRIVLCGLCMTLGVHCFEHRTTKWGVNGSY